MRVKEEILKQLSWQSFDKLVKYAHFLALSHPIRATNVASSLMNYQIITNRDPIFMNDLFKLHGVELFRSTAFHPQTDRELKTLNRTVEGYLRCSTGDKPTKWVDYLSYADYWYNTKFHATTEMTPLEALCASCTNH